MPPLPPIPPQYRFTPAEREVLEALAEGKSYREIADWLGIAESTVGSHVKNITAKLPDAPDLRPMHRIMHALWAWDLAARNAEKKAA